MLAYIGSYDGLTDLPKTKLQGKFRKRFIHTLNIYFTGIFFFGLLYSQYRVIFPVENSIFFPNPQEKIHNWKLQNKKKWIENSRIWNHELLHYYSHIYSVLMIENAILDSYSLCSLNHCKITVVNFFQIFNKTQLKIPITWIWVMFLKYFSFTSSQLIITEPVYTGVL